MSETTTISFRLLPHELKNISFYFICNVIDNIQPRADWDGEFKWGKEDASELIVSSIDTIRGLDEDMWSDLRAVLLERYKGK
jgi:hypothetical protein